MLFGPHLHPCLPLSLGIFPSLLSQYVSTSSSLTSSHGRCCTPFPAVRFSLEPPAVELEVEAVGGASVSRGTTLPERVEPAEREGAGVAVPEAGVEERAEGAGRGV